MGRQEQLRALNTPYDYEHYTFDLNDAVLDCVILDLLDVGNFSGDAMSFTITTEVGNYQLSSDLDPTSTNESLFDGLTIVYPTGITGLETDYFKVIYYLNKIYVIFKIKGLTFLPDFDETCMSITDSTYTNTYRLKHAPDGWNDDEFTLSRDMRLFGMYQKFSTSELKFVKDGRDWLIDLYELFGVNADATLTVREWTFSRLSKIRFIGKIDFSTFKQTEISCDVQVKDASFADLLLDRAKTDVNVLGLRTVDNQLISAASTELVTLPAINIDQVGNWHGYDYTTVFPGLHYLFMRVANSEYSEASDVEMYGANFFANATEEYTGANLNLKIEATLNGSDSSARFTWNYYISKWVSGVETIIYTGSVLGIGVYPLLVDIDITEIITINAGDSLSLRGNITNTVGTGSVQFTSIAVNLSTQVESLPERTVYGMLYHELYERLVYIYTGYSGRFKSDFFGRTDIGYDADGTALGILTNGRYIRGNYGLNDTLAVSLEKLFNSHQALYCLGMGIETIGGIEKLVIEPMSYFFDNHVVLNISSRIAFETIEMQYYPELVSNRISVGYSNNDTRSLGGIYEYNTTSKFTTPIKPVDKELNLVSPYRADLSGVIELIREPAENKDVSGESDNFILDSIRDGSDYIVRTLEGFEQAEDLGNTDTLINLAITPKRNLLRWGSYLRGFLDKYLINKLLFQTADKNTKLSTTETGQSAIVESDPVLISSLAAPLWVPEIVQFEVPQLAPDLETILANPYGLIQYGTTEYGWLLRYQAKNENNKQEFTLLRCNTDYVTPVGDVVFPATIKIQKTVSNAPVDYTVFHVNIVGDNGISYMNVPIQGNNGIIISNVPYGNYTVTEEDELGYTLVGITPSTFEISLDNLHQICEVENTRNGDALEITFDDIANVPVSDAASLSDWNTFFDLPAYGGAFTSVVVDGDTVKLYGGENITIKEYLFFENMNIVSIHDYALCINEIKYVAFYSCSNMVSVKLNAVLTMPDSSVFTDCDLLEMIELINLTFINEANFTGLESISIIKLNSCTSLGPSVLDNSIFLSTTGQTITLTIPSALMTCNGGNPDGDIQYLQANNTVTIVTV